MTTETTYRVAYVGPGYGGAGLNREFSDSEAASRYALDHDDPNEWQIQVIVGAAIRDTLTWDRQIEEWT